MERLIVRGYANGKLVFEERVDISEPHDVRDLTTKHLKALEPYGQRIMIEIECLDMPINERFVRIGTDPRLMVSPIRIPLSNGPD